MSAHPDKKPLQGVTKSLLFADRRPLKAQYRNWLFLVGHNLDLLYHSCVLTATGYLKRSTHRPIHITTIPAAGAASI
jgi:hypothetical protein